MRYLLAYWLTPLEQRIAALEAQLRASRAEHDALLRRYAALEHDFGEVCEEFVKERIDRCERGRMVVPWATGPLIVEN